MYNKSGYYTRDLFIPLGIKDSEPNYNFDRHFLKMEEQYLLSKSLLDQISEKEVTRVDNYIPMIKNYSRKGNKEIFLDAIWLLEYLEAGGKLSGYLFEIQRIFASKIFKKRLYFLHSIYVKGKPCNTAEAITIVKRQMEVFIKLDRILEIWDVQIPTFNSSYEKYHFSKQLITWSEELLQEQSKAFTSCHKILRSLKIM